MKISDRAIGYLFILAVLCIIALVSLGMYHAHHNQCYTATVDFNELGSLQPEDIVVVRGYNVGTIKSVTWLGDRSRVVINFDEPIIIRKGTEFNNVNYALMGQRRLEITLSKTGNVLPESFIHKGHFEPGIAEALRLMEDVNSQLTQLREMVLLIANGDSNHSSAPEVYEKIMSTVEGILENADKSISTITPKLNETFAQINEATQSIVKVTKQADTAIHVTTDAINEKIGKVEDVVKTIADGTQKANQVIADLENSPAVNKLLYSNESIEKVNNLVKKLNEIIAAIDTKGIKVYDENGKPIKLVTWKNINLIGKTAREKASERANNE